MAKRTGKILPPQGEGFGIVPGRMITDGRGLSADARCLYAVIWFHRVMSAEFPPMDELAAQIGAKTKGPVIKAIDELEGQGWLKVVRTPGRPNDYQPLDGSGRTVEVSDKDHATAQAARKEPKGDPMRRTLTDWFMAQYEKRFGHKYRFAGGRDGSAVTGFLEYFRGQGLDPLTMDGDGRMGTFSGPFADLVWKAWSMPTIMGDRYLSAKVKTLHGLLEVLNQIQPLLGPGPGKKVEGYGDLERKAI